VSKTISVTYEEQLTFDSLMTLLRGEAARKGIRSISDVRTMAMKAEE